MAANAAQPWWLAVILGVAAIPAVAAIAAPPSAAAVAVVPSSSPKVPPSPLPPPTAAPSPAPAPAPAPPDTQQIVIDGRANTEGEQRRDAILGITIVGREELDRYGDTSVLDVLQRLPGITVDGEQPRMRGMGAGYTLILINGDPAPPGFTLESLAPADIERIEIIKGPAAEFGGVAGTINVILRVAPKLRQREGRANLGYRALGAQGSASLSWGDRVGEGGALGFHVPISVYSWANAAGFSTFRLSRLAPPPGQSVPGEARDQQVLGRDEWRGEGFNFTPKLDLKLSATDSLSWQTLVQGNRSHNRSQRQTQVLAGPPLTTVDDRSTSEGEWQLWRGQLQWQRKTADGLRLELKGSAQGTLSRGTGDSQGRDALGAPTLQRASRWGLRESTAALGGRWRQPLAALVAPTDQNTPHTPHTLVMGWDVDQRLRRELRGSVEGGVERLTGAFGQPFTADIRRAVVFVQDEWLPLPRLSALLGLRWERLDITTTGPGQVVTHTPQALLPILQLRHAWDDKGRDVLRMGLARSQRVPDVGLLLPRYALNGAYDRDTPNTPLAADSAGNPLLQPETAIALDLALEKTLPGGAVFSAGLFHRQIDKLIRRRIALENVLEASVQRWVSRPGNLGAARSSGLELEVKGRAEELLPAWFDANAKPGSGLQLRASLSLYRSRVELIDDPDARLEGQAPWGATLGFDHLLRGTRFSYGGNLGISPGFSTQQTDRQRVWRGSSQRLDTYALWRIDRQTQLRLAGNNLLAADNLSSSQIADLDGFTASSLSRRDTKRQITLAWVQRF